MPRRDRRGGKVAGAEKKVKGYTLDETEKTMALHYQLKVKGVLDDTWSEWFDGMTITHDVAGNTLLEGAVCNQTEL